MSTDTTREGMHAEQDADELRDAMVDEVIVDREWVGVVPHEVEAALRTVPRHLFAPEVPLDQAYVDRAVVTKRTERGSPISSVSAPQTGPSVPSRLRPNGKVGRGGSQAMD
ncbi:MAG: hypothetical protein ACRDQ5_02400 [Sciscionella sp.]